MSSTVSVPDIIIRWNDPRDNYILDGDDESIFMPRATEISKTFKLYYSWLLRWRTVKDNSKVIRSSCYQVYRWEKSRKTFYK